MSETKARGGWWPRGRRTALGAIPLAFFGLLGGCQSEEASGPRTSPQISQAVVAQWDSRGWATWSKRREPVLRNKYHVASDPSVLRDGSTYRMFYTCFDPDRQGPAICQTVSQDRLSWTDAPVDDGMKGRMLQTREGHWDEHHEGAAAIRRGSECLLYYSGYKTGGTPIPNFPAFLAAARSEDCLHFQRISDEPILKPTSGWYDNDAIFSPTVVDLDGVLTMVYTGHCYTNCLNGAGVFLLAATSRDGRTFTKHKSPVMKPSNEHQWTRNGLAEAALARGPDGFLYLFVTGALGDDEKKVIGVARSKTVAGPWELNPQPILSPTAGRFDDSGVLAPSVLIEGNIARMWFTGINNKSQMAVGYAEAPLPLRQEQ
jgi:predicted GH43/DUF377 family glycosyl hydrolase